MPSPPLPGPHWCLFLDFDGTLVELRDHPAEVAVPPRLLATLDGLRARLDGALAIVSGRGIDDLDRLLAPLRLPVAGVHGLERRDSAGVVHRDNAAGHALDPVRRAIAGFVARHPGLAWEDKGSAIALHYRRAPARQAEAERFMRDQRGRLGDGFHLQHGKAVLELKAGPGHKGDAIARFMDEEPFMGRRPVYVGDDATDEDGFARVNRLDGISIRVGGNAGSHARHTLPDVAAVLDWLEHLENAAST